MEMLILFVIVIVMVEAIHDLYETVTRPVDVCGWIVVVTEKLSRLQMSLQKMVIILVKDGLK